MDVPTFAPEAYTAGDHFQREKRGLFARTWLPFCAADQIARAGAFVNHTLGGWPILAIRGGDGIARAFHNVCRHQSMPVVDKPAGQCEELRCRFHGWTYDLAGAFVTAPPLVAPTNADPAARHLRAVELADNEGVLFVRLESAADGQPSFGLGGQRFVGAATTDVDANWKAFVESALPDPSWRFVWPVAFLGTVDGVRVVRQVIPRTFTRTRIVDLLFAEPGGAMDAARTGTAASVAEAKRRAEALQAQRAAGDVAAESEAVAAFRARVASAA
jgi:nitrite reductase/ring-hydroxylating ferredoxin subunit